MAAAEVKGNPKGLAEPRHPTIAISDFFMGSCCFYAAWLTVASLRVSALGFAAVGSACYAGVLRFGAAPETFRALNEQLAAFAGRVGIPLVGFGFLGQSAAVRSALLPSLGDTEALFALALLCAASLSLPVAAQELYTTLASGAGMAAVAYWGATVAGESAAPHALGGVMLFLVGGLIIGPEREQYMLGCRCENLFHYCCGTALLMIAKAAPGVKLAL